MDDERTTPNAPNTSARHQRVDSLLRQGQALLTGALLLIGLAEEIHVSRAIFPTVQLCGVSTLIIIFVWTVAALLAKKCGIRWLTWQGHIRTHTKLNILTHMMFLGAISAVWVGHCWPTPASEGRGITTGITVMRGTVLFERSKRPVPGAQVSVKETGQWTLTDAEGRYEISHVAVSDPTLIATYHDVDYSVPPNPSGVYPVIPDPVPPSREGTHRTIARRLWVESAPCLPNVRNGGIRRYVLSHTFSVPDDLVAFHLQVRVTGTTRIVHAELVEPQGSMRRIEGQANVPYSPGNTPDELICHWVCVPSPSSAVPRSQVAPSVSIHIKAVVCFRSLPSRAESTQSGFDSSYWFEVPD